MKRIALILCGVSCLLFADIVSHQKVQTSHTQRAEFPAGGVLHVKHTDGDLTIEGWDRPDVEILTVESTKADHLPKEHEKATQAMTPAPLSVERHGDELAVAGNSSWLHGAFSKTELWCNIKAPFNARIDVEHGAGEVHIDNMTSAEIRVHVSNGAITLHLPPEGPYHIDAKSHFGGVQSDFPGEEQRRWWLLGHRYAQVATEGRNLHLRVNIGDITILKIRTPIAQPPVAR
jgi:hypothetical protein